MLPETASTHDRTHAPKRLLQDCPMSLLARTPLIWMVAAVAGLGAWPAAAASPTLSQQWLASGEAPEHPGYAFFQLHRDEPAQQDQARELLERLQRLEERVGTGRGPRVPEGTPAAWRGQLRAQVDQPGRSHGRADPAGLLAAPRHDPSLNLIRHYGHCTPPTWVELWTLEGVERVPWEPGMSVSSVVRALPAAARRRVDNAALVDTRGQVRRLGVAAWNREDAPLPPGARLILEWPGEDPDGVWLNEHLPAYLGTRLPSDQCTVLSIQVRD